MLNNQFPNRFPLWQLQTLLRESSHSANCALRNPPLKHNRLKPGTYLSELDKMIFIFLEFNTLAAYDAWCE